MTGVYIYCIVSSDRPLPTPIAGREELRSLPLGRIAVVVRDHDVETPLRPSDLADHVAVLDDLMRDGALLPCRFGVVAPDENSIRDQWGRHDTWYDNELQRLGGRGEMAVSCTYREEAVLARMAEENSSIRRESERTRSGSVGQQVEFGASLARAMEQRAQDEGGWIRDRLLQHAENISVRDQKPGVVLRAAFLVDNDRLQAFLAEADAIRGEVGSWVELSCNGPLPPYSFVRHPETALSGV